MCHYNHHDTPPYLVSSCRQCPVHQGKKETVLNFYSALFLSEFLSEFLREKKFASGFIWAT